MAIISICNNQEVFYQLDSTYSDFYNKSYECEEAFGLAETFSKLNVKTANHYVSGSGDFALGVGSFLVDGTFLDQDALKIILKDFNTPQFSRSRITGVFCIAVYKSRKLTIFVDESSDYDLFYHIDDKVVTITNSYYHLARTLDGVKVDEAALAQKLFYLNILGNKSPFLGVDRLLGNQCIVWDVEHGWNVLPFNRMVSITAENVISYSYERYKGIDRLFRNSALFMTGGQDSRLMLSFLLRQGFKPSLIYGESDSPSLITRKNDKQIVETIAEKMELPITIENWSNNRTNFEIALEKYGEYALDYGYNANYLASFERCKVELIESGYHIELFRNVDVVRGFENKYLSLDEFISKIYLGRNLKTLLSDWQELWANMRVSLEALCKELGLDKTHLSCENCVSLLAAAYYPSSINFFNLANRFAYSFSFLGDWDIGQKLAIIPPKDKAKSKMQIAAIKSFCPELLNFPFFSHVREQTLKGDKAYLEDKHKALVRVKRVVQKSIPKNAIYKYLRILYRRLTGNTGDIVEINQEASLVREIYDDLQGSIVLFGIDPKAMSEEYALLTQAEMFVAYDKLLKQVFK